MTIEDGQFIAIGSVGRVLSGWKGVRRILGL
jgi:hypothetical protein